MAVPPLATLDHGVALAASREASCGRSTGARVRLRSRRPGGTPPTRRVQGWLHDLGLALGFDVWIASNDRSRPTPLGASPTGVARTAPPPVIFDGPPRRSASSTPIYSGIVRMLDLALSGETTTVRGMYPVAPDAREDEVRTQLRRPAFSRIADLHVRYLPYSELSTHREAIARFGRGLRPVEQLARDLR